MIPGKEAEHIKHNVMVKCGFLPKLSKSVTPTQRIKTLGFIVDSVEMTVTISKAKADNVVHLCKQLIQQKHAQSITCVRS